MNNEEQPKKDMMDAISNQFSRMYDTGYSQGFRHGVSLSITTVRNIMGIPHHANDNFAFYQEVIKQLEKLTSNEAK